MPLQKEINEMSKVINTDSYSMSIGELASIYKESELDLHPEFQRFFRWDIKQKSNLIESILLGIPIPPIFVSQNESGVWDVIDGLQRLSTIFEFMGFLVDEDNKKIQASTLIKTKFLPSLEGKVWESEDEKISLTSAQRMYIKRSKLDIKIVEKTSDPSAKYELFQRLNSGGTHLSPQEIRNCLLVMISKTFFELLKEMKDNQDFIKALPLSENSLEKQDDMELIVRYIVARHSDMNQIKKDENIHDYLTEKITEIAQNEAFDYQTEKISFAETFSYLSGLLGEDVFKKYYDGKDRFEGGVLISSFESIVLGVSRNIDKVRSMEHKDILAKIKSIYNNPVYLEYTKRGTRAINRFKNLSLLSMEIFTNED